MCCRRRRYFGVSLSPGDKGLYYSRFTPHEGTTVWLHTFGTPLEKDVKVFGGEYRGVKLGELDLIGAGVTDNRTLSDRPDLLTAFRLRATTFW